MNWLKKYECFLSMILLKQILSNPCGDGLSLALNITQGLFISDSFEVATLPSLQQCADLCLQFSLCKSINFDQETRTCYLHQHNTNTDPFFDASTKNSMYYMDYRDIPKTLTGACRNHNCSIFDKCIPTSETNYICLTILKSEWKCHTWAPEELAALIVESFSHAARTRICEMVEYRLYYATNPLKPKGCGTCFCCKIVFSSGNI